MKDLAPFSEIELLQGGEALFAAMIKAFDAATQEVRLETYIFHFEGAPMAVAQALERAALRGVRVFVMVDGVGTGELPPLWAQRFKAAGVDCRVYLPLKTWGLWQPSRWRRLHRKLCVVDQQVAFCGGINLLDDFLDPHTHTWMQSPRLDYALRLQGPLVQAVSQTMQQLWAGMQLMRDEHDTAHGALREVWRRLEPPQRPAHSPHKARLVLRDNLWHRVGIERAYRQAIGAAHQDVVLACAFFFPGIRLRRALTMAARRGVRVRLLMQGHYEYFWSYRATRQLYGQLLEAGVEIYEYQASFLHAKVAVVDQRWMTVGSSNLDPLSLLLAREANVMLEHPPLAQTLHQSLTRAMTQGAVAVDARLYLTRGWMARAVDMLAAALLRLGVFLAGKRYWK